MTTTTTLPVASASTLPALPPNFTHLSSPTSNKPLLITQGAEALLFETTYLLPTLPSALKFRPSKPYRHPTLDARLTKHRILSEARVLGKCRREGVPVPGLYAVDEGRGWLMLEWIEGDVVRVVVNSWLGDGKGRGEDEGNGEGTGKEMEELRGLMERIGDAVGKLHGIGVVHGDLTTSNLMLRPLVSQGEGEGGGRKGKLLDGEIILIDFGLASQTSSDEDRAVDLYVLERAFGSTHPRAEGLFGEVLKAYGKAFKGANVVLRKLEDVRMRGRKRSMLG